MSSKENFFNYKLKKKDKEYCLSHAKKMTEGFETYSFKNEKNQSLDVYNIGKIGELVFWKFIKNLEKKILLKIMHKPFRENYDKLNFKDDFIIEVDGKEVQIEVRTKGRNVEPQLNYECCTDCIKPHLIYVFLSFNKKKDEVSLLGFADWDVLRKHANAVYKGMENFNFKHKVNEFNIEIQHLYDINTLIEYCTNNRK